MPRTLTPGQRAALVNLLGDEDPAIYTQVRETILALGPAACEWLSGFALSDDPVIRRRVNEVISTLKRLEADEAFLSFCLSTGENIDLERAVFLLAKTRFPLINVEAYQALLDMYAEEALHEILFTRGTLQLIEALNEFLFDQIHFAPALEHGSDPNLNYINVVLDTRKGNAITLAMLYMFIGGRLKLPMAPVSVPGHFLCRIQTSTEELYVDCHNFGTPLSRTDCVHYLVRNNYEIREEYLQPVSPRKALMRLCANLHKCYSSGADPSEAARVQRYVVALAR